MSTYEKIELHRPPPIDQSDDTDAEASDDGIDPRTSTEIRRHDRDILETEEEAEKLMTGVGERASSGRGLFGRDDGSGNAVRISKKERREYKREARREARKSRRRRKKGEESELMYDMEEGGHRDSGESSGSSSDVDRQTLEKVQSTKHAPKARLGRFAGIYVVIFFAFWGLLYGAYRASRRTSYVPLTLSMLSNGTSTFAPTTILISLDGFRADFLHRNITPSLNALVRSGVSPRYMLPSFPSVTFPNHFTLVTGLYPEAHGIVGNTFWDPTLEEEFYYTDPVRSMQPKWWHGEPIWETAEAQGLRTAIHMWPGSEAHIDNVEPTYIDKYNGKEPLSNKVDRILGLLDIPGPEEPSANANTPRPQLIAAYVPNVDADGHLYGPNSTEIRKTIASVDAMIGDITAGLEERNLTDIVNIVVVSDHGMATTSTARLIQVDDIIDMSLIEHTDGWPLYGLRPKNMADLQPLYEHLKAEAKTSEGFDVYLRDSDMPARYHFSQNERIAPLWIVPRTGWAIVTKSEFDISTARAQGLVYHPRGVHGYDHEHPLMRAIFMARGPAFPHTPNSKIDVFQNIEVYNIVCDSLGIQPKPNNGTLRLPLKTVGIHDRPPPDEIPEDLPADDILGFNAPASTSENVTPSATTSEQASAAVSSRPAPTRPVVHDGEKEDDEKGDINLWWAWVHGKLDGVKDWATGLFNKVDNGTRPSGD